MIGLAYSLLFAVQALPGQSFKAHELDPLMQHVTQGCLLPDLAEFDPNKYFLDQGWQKNDGLWSNDINGVRVVLKVRWPATESDPAACSFYSADLEPEAYHSWFVARIGEPNDRPWDSADRYAIWKINTNDHGVGIYTARDKSPDTGDTVSVIHILQDSNWK